MTRRLLCLLLRLPPSHKCKNTKTKPDDDEEKFDGHTDTHHTTEISIKNYELNRLSGSCIQRSNSGRRKSAGPRHRTERKEGKATKEYLLRRHVTYTFIFALEKRQERRRGKTAAFHLWTLEGHSDLLFLLFLAHENLSCYAEISGRCIMYLYTNKTTRTRPKDMLRARIYRDAVMPWAVS